MAPPPVPVVAVDVSVVRLPAGASAAPGRGAPRLRRHLSHARTPLALNRAAAEVRRRLVHGRERMAQRHATRTSGGA
ncbi:hypothetical protein ACFVOR_30515 [Streptomyces sp. NPDC057837]|uniref:hypothetical protein n=1 Tax=Streptomyces sp. NPDC057837 TaxID=3346260 RepID=UPI003687D6D7